MGRSARDPAACVNKLDPRNVTIAAQLGIIRVAIVDAPPRRGRARDRTRARLGAETAQDMEPILERQMEYLESIGDTPGGCAELYPAASLVAVRALP